MVERTEMPSPTDVKIKPGSGFSSWLRYAAMPVSLAIVCAVLYLWNHGMQLDSIEKRSLNADTITRLVLQHIELTVVAAILVIAIAVPRGILLTRPSARRLTAPVTAIDNIGQAVPSIGVLVLLAIWVGLGFWPAIVAFALYSILPVLRNTMVGLQQIDP